MDKSKLTLGTVQLGMKYGIANTHGQTTAGESFAILDRAFKDGINTFDTAYAYGTAEEVLGEWITTRGISNDVCIISKLKPDAFGETLDDVTAGEMVLEEVKKSLARLKLKKLDGYLLHSAKYLYVASVMEGLRKVKEEGFAEHVGVSIYDETEALDAVKAGIEYIEVPYNVFDQRLDATDFFNLAKKNNVTVFARSPFLQGLLLMKPDALPPHLASARPHLEKFIDMCTRYGASPVRVALHFVDAHPGINHIVFGVDTLQQLESTLSMLAESLPDQLFTELRESFKNVATSISNPAVWNTLKA